MASFLNSLIRNPTRVHRLRNQRNGAILADRLRPAFDSEARRTGLLKHDSLPDGEALVIAPSNAIHTFFMKFPIDVAFVARDGRLLKIRHRVGPWRLATSLRAHAVIELPAGTLSRADSLQGDRLEIIQSDGSQS